MIPLAKIATVCFVLGLAKVKADIKTVRDTRLSFEISKQRVHASRENLSNNYKKLQGFPYAVCDNDHFEARCIKCRIVIHSDALPGKACGVTLKATGTNDSILRKILQCNIESYW